jgi:ElaB/YqjD/DUF883 family membrane-anchored ribosome-binding protein
MEPTRTTFANGTDDVQNQDGSKDTSVQARVAAVKQQVTEAGEQVMSRARSALAQVEAFARRSPLAAIGIGLGAGFLLGRLSKRF